jgi:hypothetical protein
MPQFMLRGPTAEYLSSKVEGSTVTPTALANMASKGEGPEYHIINGRACYTKEACDRWIAEQAARPVSSSRRGRRAEHDAQSAA